MGGRLTVDEDGYVKRWEGVSKHRLVDHGRPIMLYIFCYIDTPRVIAHMKE